MKSFSIHLCSALTAVVFAGEELKKYLRMMMPEAGEIPVDFDARAEEGFRLGLMADLGLACPETREPEKDDVVLIETDEAGGILAGSNPRSVLFAVYRYLKCNGCRWIFPGLDGEKIPLRAAEPVRYRKMAAHRFRGQCNEGSESQQCMLDTIDFNAKMELNSYMMEFSNPYIYYKHWYLHEHNPAVAPEPVSRQTVLQWKRQCETEISRRGLSFHDMGHGWTAEPFGFDSSNGWADPVAAKGENVQVLAQIGGVREFWGGIALNTNLCLSREDVRETMARAIADYADAHRNVDYLHIWMADGCNNHCECDACRKKRPTDWYVMMLNRADQLMTQARNPMHLVCIAYYDTLWVPEQARFSNPARFTLLFAPLSRSYLDSYDVPADPAPLRPYVRNRLVWPGTVAEGLAYLRSWQEKFPIDVFCYEYHMYVSQYYSLGGIFHAGTLWRDIRGLKRHGLGGMIEDGSQRSCFPNGFLWYVYGETLFDPSRTWESLKKDYFQDAYGERGEEICAFLEKLEELVPFDYLACRRPGGYRDEAMEENLLRAAELAEAMGNTLPGHSDVRAEDQALQLLADYCRYVQLLCRVLGFRAAGQDARARQAAAELLETMGRREVYIQKWYDQYLMTHAYRKAFFD